MTKKLSYWERRQLKVKARQLQNTRQLESTMQTELVKTYHDIAKEASMWVDKYTKNQGMNSEQAMKSLHDIRTKHWQITLKQFEAKAKKGGYEAELNNEYYRSRIARLSALEEQMRQLTRTIARKHTATMRTALGKQYDETYMRTTYNTQAQKGVFTSDFARFNETQLKMIASNPWGKDGKDFSQRIWKNYQQELPSYLMDSLFRATVMGWGPQKVGQMMHAQFQDVQRNRVHNLVTSEMGHIAEEATARSYEESGVDQYEYMATLESHTCTTCGHLDGQHFKTIERKVGINYPLIHARCRCTTIPYIADLPDVSERWMRDPETGKGKMTKDAKFDEWRDYIANDYLKSRPYINSPTVKSNIYISNNVSRYTAQVAEKIIENNKYLKNHFKDEKLNISFDDSLFINHPDSAGVTPYKNSKSIVLNPAICKSNKSVISYVNKNKGWFVNVKPSEAGSYPIIHELGHVFHNEMWDEYLSEHQDTELTRTDFVDGEIDKLYNMYEQKYGEKVTLAKLPSGYSKQNSKELFAELFVLSQTGYNSNKWKSVVKQYLKGVNN